MQNKFLKGLLVTTAFAGFGGFALSQVALAQETDTDTVETIAAKETDEARQETVYTTGTRLAIPDYAAISPVTSVPAAQVELSATLNVESLLNELPQVIPGNTVTSNNSGGEDFATLDLRGLGPGRTLILVDGERVVPSSPTGVVDINTIPAGLIDRIEVVTGGASAVYGSDAIAGVVNFILKDDYEGAEINVSKFGAWDGNAPGVSANLLMGGNFDNGKGNVTTYASYDNRDGVLQGEYDYSRTSAAVVYGYDLVNGGYAQGAAAVVDTLDEYLAALNNIQTNYPGYTAFTFPGGSATPPWGFISNNAANPFGGLNTNPATPTFASVDSDCNPATANTSVSGGSLSFNDQGQLVPRLAGGYCAIPDRAAGSSRYNYAPDNYIFIPATRYGIQTFVTYDVTPDIEMKTMLSYVRSQSSVQLAATPITGLSIPVTSPAISGADGVLGTADDPHADLSAALLSRPNSAANFTYAWRSNGVGPREGDFENSGLTARVSFAGSFSEAWKWNVSAGWGQVDFVTQGRNNVNRVALLQGVAGCDNIDPSARLPDCVNVDIFGPPSVTDAAMASFIRTDVQTQQRTEQTNFSAYVTGSLFELPAGPVATVFGVEYREDAISLKVDDAQRRGEIAGFNAIQSIFGSLDVYEAYTEVKVPLLADQPLVEELAVEAAYRYSDYSTVGALETYKYGATYAPTDWLRFRAVYNKAARAPSALEAFQAGDQGFPSYTDPCRSTVTGSNAALLAFCTTNGNIGGGFVPAAVAPTFAQNNSQVQAFAFGNPNLSPENGETLTAGVVFQPDFLPVGDLKMTVDYFDIKLTEEIVSRGASTILSSCYNNLGSTPQSAFDCQQIVRDPATGQIVSVNTSLTNSISETNIKGWDIQAEYGFDLNEFFGKAPGSLNINVLLTLNDKWEAGGVDYVGITFAGIGGAIPDWKSVTTVNYDVGDLTLQLRHGYIPSLEQAYFGGADTEAFSNFDVSAGWDVTDRLRVVGNISNLFDEFPPQTVTGVLDQGNTDSSLYAPWVVGRTFSLSAKYKF